jgi:outer membrane receptor for monomeric catechols
MYQPTDEVSYYAAYGTSFNTSGDLYQFDPNSANTAPESSRNMEIGAKWELYGGDLSLRAALARTEKYNERNTDIDTNTNSFLLSGKRHTDALEFEVAGRITPQWDVFAGIGFLKAKIDKSGSNAAGQPKSGKTRPEPQPPGQPVHHLPHRRQVAHRRRLHRRQHQQAGQQRHQHQPRAGLRQGRRTGGIPHQ